MTPQISEETFVRSIGRSAFAIEGGMMPPRDPDEDEEDEDEEEDEEPAVVREPDED